MQIWRFYMLIIRRYFGFLLWSVYHKPKLESLFELSLKFDYPDFKNI